MFFFACDLENVPYGWIRGTCKKGDYFETAYKWLAQYCNFFPPLFLSSDHLKLSGYSVKADKILFTYKNISGGFPVSYDGWMRIVGILLNLDTNNFRLIDERLVDGLKDLQALGEVNLSKYRNLDDFVQATIFTDSEQFVVQSLDLRRANSIVCHNEIQKTALVRKGFQSGQIRIISSFSRMFII